MPSRKSAETRSSRSRSRSRGRLTATKSKSRSKSRSRSRSRSRGRSNKSPSRATKTKDVTTPGKIKAEKFEKPPLTPTRTSARIAAKEAEKVEPDTKEQTKETTPVKREKLVEMSDKEKPKTTTTSREFCGAIGTTFLTFFLPLVIYAVNISCSKESCSIRSLPKIPSNWRSYLDLEAAGIYLGWLAFQVVLALLPIGKVVEGQHLRSGGKLKYRCNGFYALLISIMAFGAAVYFKVPVTRVHDKYLQLITTGVITSFLFAVFLYVKAKRCSPSRLAPGGNSGNIFYDFFMGHELNPRIGQFDLKFFCEMRPGLIGWVVLNLIFIVKSAEELGKPSPSLLLVAVFQILYVADGLWFEEAILTTMDIIHDGFGFMLAFGDLVWVPFLFTVASRFLLEHPQSLPWYCLAAIAVLNFIGYFIFRGSNSQKNEFRRNPNNPALSHLETIPTSSGKRLLISGWWGLCRKPNYLGDLLMATAWSLPCGFHHFWPFFYPLQFAILLIHRERRDGEICKKKYRSSWERYCERVKYRIVPYVY